MNPEPHPVSSPSKAVDVMSVLRARCKADAVNDDFNMLAATAAVEKLIAVAEFAALLKFKQSGKNANAAFLDYRDCVHLQTIALAALSTIGESQ